VKRSLAEEADGRSIIAGYHWFGDWGRDTMIALPLTTGRADIARKILLAFARHVDGGMLPNDFPDAGGQPEYNTVDEALWYFEAVRQYFAETLGCCYDVVDSPGIGNDASLRPNQIFVASLPKSPLTPEQQRAVVDVCARRLVTSHGLRSGAGRAGLSRALRRCPSRPRRSLSPRDGVGLADGLVRLGPSAGVPRPQRSSAFSRTTRKTNHFAWPRDFKRDLRRRRTIHAPWMHRPSLDRGRSLKRLEGDSGVELPPVACKLCWTSASLLRVMRAESVLLIFESCLLLLSSKVR